MVWSGDFKYIKIETALATILDVILIEGNRKSGSG